MSGKDWSHNVNKGSQGWRGEKRLGILCLVWNPRLYFLPGIWSLDLFLLAGERESGLGGGGCCSQGLPKTLEVSLLGPWFSLCPPNPTWTERASSEVTLEAGTQVVSSCGSRAVHCSILGLGEPTLPSSWLGCPRPASCCNCYNTPFCSPKWPVFDRFYVTLPIALILCSLEEGIQLISGESLFQQADSVSDSLKHPSTYRGVSTFWVLHK